MYLFLHMNTTDFSPINDTYDRPLKNYNICQCRGATVSMI
jgi:hypothetical protein